jgi:hypothetical protein
MLMFYLPRTLLEGGHQPLKRESFFSHFLSMNYGNHTMFQVLAIKVNNEVVVARIFTAREYGSKDALSYYLGISQPH